jgi:hypothetical protein
MRSANLLSQEGPARASRTRTGVVGLAAGQAQPPRPCVAVPVMALFLSLSSSGHVLRCGHAATPSLPRVAHAPACLDVDHAKLPYEVPPLPKPFADYEWDPSFPGTFKPGTRGENQDLDAVLEAWKDRENPACMQLPQDALWQVCRVCHPNNPNGHGDEFRITCSHMWSALVLVPSAGASCATRGHSVMAHPHWLARG